MNPISRGQAAVVVLVISVGLAVRLSTLTGAAVNYEEALAWDIGQNGFSELTHALWDLGQPPLFYLGLKAWCSLFGDSIFAMRSLSVAWSGLLLLAGILLATVRGEAQDKPMHEFKDKERRSRFVPHPALAVALLLTLSPALLHYSREITPHMASAALSTLTIYWLARMFVAHDSRPSVWVGLMLSWIALCYTTFVGIYLLPVVIGGGFYSLVVNHWMRRADERVVGQAALQSASMVLSLLAVAPILINCFEQTLPSRALTPQEMPSVSALSLMVWRLVALKLMFLTRGDVAQGYLATWSLELAIAALLLLTFSPWKIVRWIALGAQSIVIVWIGTDLCLSRNTILYPIGLPIAALLFVAGGIAIGSIRLGSVRWILTIAITFVFVRESATYIQSLDLRGRVDLVDVCDSIHSDWQFGDMAVVVSGEVAGPAVYHARGRFPVEILPGMTGSTEDLTTSIERVRPTRIWLVGCRPEMAAEPSPREWQKVSERNFRARIWQHNGVFSLWVKRSAAD